MPIVRIETPVHGRLVHVSRGDDRLLVGFHGYAETAEIHVAQLELIPGIAAWSVAAVQALHPFYTRAGNVVASWMTSQDRELAIADNREYVRRVVSALPPAKVLVFAGFSQGAAMAARAAAAESRSAGLILLGGDLPDEITADPHRRLPPVLIGRGSRDEWHTAEKLKKDLRYLDGKDVTVCEFDGGHEWTDGFRAAAAAFLARVARE